MSRVAVVTGASAGVGRAVASGLARRGWKVGLIARSAAALEEARAEVLAHGAPAALVVAADVADAEAVFAAADRVEAELGPVSLWVNDAMATVFAPVSKLAPEEVRRVTEVTYLGCVHGTMAALRHMRPRGQGTILQIGSALAYRAIPLQAAYCGAKFAIRGFTDSLRSELLHDRSRIRVTMVQLPAVNTPQFDWSLSHMPRRARPVPPVHQPDAVAERICDVALCPPRELWIGGATLRAIIANMLAPGLLDRFLARNAYDGQMTPEAESADRTDNLFIPTDWGHATDGRFAAEARPQAPAFDPTLLRGVLAAAALAVPVALAWRSSRRRALPLSLDAPP